VAHLNHQLRGEESDEDEAFVLDFAGGLGLPVFTERIAVAERAEAEKRNLEAVARSLRYEFLLKVAEARGANAVFTAHTLDDQAETILMRLIRGSGAEGLRGIHQTVALSDSVNLIRPTLGIMRAEVIEHCEHYELAFRSDSSNFLVDFTRNRVRLVLLPMLETFNPRVKESLARVSESLVEDEDYLRAAAVEYLAAAHGAAYAAAYAAAYDGSREESGINVKVLENVPAALRRRVLRLWLRAERGDLRRINASHIAAIESLLTGPSGRRVDLPECASVAREFDCLRFIQSGAIGKTPGPGELLGELPIELKENEPRNFGGFTFILKRRMARAGLDPGNYENHEGFRDCDELDRLWLRNRFPGAAYIPATARRAVKLKTLMIRRKIPLTQRDRYPVLATADDRIIWAPGLPVAREFAPNPEDEKCALIVAERR
jgi:tRNA(Ile)-lysidine synthase